MVHFIKAYLRQKVRITWLFWTVFPIPARSMFKLFLKWHVAITSSLHCKFPTHSLKNRLKLNKVQKFNFREKQILDQLRFKTFKYVTFLGIKVLLVVGMYGVGCLAGHVGAESLTSIWALLLGTDLRGAQKASWNEIFVPH